MNQLYQKLIGGSMVSQQPRTPQSPAMNPLQQASAIYNAMRNPSAFVRQMIPDLPADISNNPNQILEWLKQNRGVTDAQIQQIVSMVPHY